MTPIVPLLVAVVGLMVGLQSPNQILDKAMADFRAGRIVAAVSGFDRVATLLPGSAPQLWQRGIALYYAGRFEDCRRQFESHRTVNPADVENAAWHFLCVAKAESPMAARAQMLPVGPDRRVPMREIDLMFRGQLEPTQVLAAAAGNPSAEFYGHLYVGLYLEATGESARGLAEIRLAAAAPYARVGGYMHDVARVHVMARDSTRAFRSGDLRAGGGRRRLRH